MDVTEANDALIEIKSLLDRPKRSGDPMDDFHNLRTEIYDWLHDAEILLSDQLAGYPDGD